MEEDGKSGGGAREVNIRRDVEFSSDVERGGAELVDDDGDDFAFGGNGFEEAVKGRERANDGEDDDGFGFGVFREVVEVDRREIVVVDGGREGIENRDLSFGGRVAGRNGESNGEAVEGNETFGEFEKWD